MLGHVEQVDDVLAQTGRGHLLQFDRIAHLGHIGDELIGRFDAELRLRRSGGCTAPQPREFLAHEILSLRLGGGGDPVAFDPLEDIGGITAFEGFDDAVVDLPGLRADFVEEPPVVGDQQQGAGVLRPAGANMLRQPCDAVDVEVVRRLIEDEHVPIADEQSRQGDSAALTAGE